ncbi:hypothetical protein FDZ73_22360 [bacterium]|nr:MAG: hypothetical protein FDZ73_22360 [bacterium]
MDKEKLIEQIAPKLRGDKYSVRLVLEAAGYFGIMEAATSLMRDLMRLVAGEPLPAWTAVSCAELKGILKKAGVWDE